MDRIYCGRCERLLSKRSPRRELESWCGHCRALVPVAVRFRGLGLVRRSELAEAVRRLLAEA